ncbi:MAG: metal ABC transporter substrate-binding protein [Caldilineales bacterium]
MRILFSLIILVSLLLASCSAGTTAPAPANDGKLRVVATTTLVGDVVKQVGGDAIDLTVLLPVGADPHSFDPSPQDVVTISKADVIFINGAGLEEFMTKLMENANSQAPVIEVSHDIELISHEAHGDEHADEAEAHAEDEEGHDHAGADPHTWTDPNNVMIWVQAIAAELSALRPAQADEFAANAAQYTEQLQTLDTWITEQVALIPAANRNIVTDHPAFGYFAQRYGFVQVGAVIPSFSTMAEPSAQDIAALEDTIRALGVKAVFVGHTVSPDLAKRITDDTGTQLVRIYTGSLGAADSDAATYLDFTRANVNAFVQALRP